MLLSSNRYEEECDLVDVRYQAWVILNHAMNHSHCSGCCGTSSHPHQYPPSIWSDLHQSPPSILSNPCQTSHSTLPGPFSAFTSFLFNFFSSPSSISSDQVSTRSSPLSFLLSLAVRRKAVEPSNTNTEKL